MTYYAHSGTPGDKRDWQTMPDHAVAVARLAAEFAAPSGLEEAAFLEGLFHDLGKYDPRFPPRLEGANVRVDHSTAGAAVLLELARGGGKGMAELCAYAILGHHAGLPDKLNASPSCFRERVRSFADRLDPVWKEELPFDLSGLAPPDPFKRLSADPAQKAFDLSVVVRMLFSALVDADFKDTERHYSALEHRQPDRSWTPLQVLLPGFVAAFDARIAGMPKGGELNPLRSEILAHVRTGAAREPGLFTLTVPTGGGKTLASFGFALDHAKRWGHRRIIYAIPFTSIIDQSAAILRGITGDAHVLEHHSAIEEDEKAGRHDAKLNPASRDRLKLATEDWAAPVVVTTNVQLFESLFAAKTSRARKLHAIANSIIILDEAQTIPRHVLKPCMRMLDTLARMFGCTILLCTATQPALARRTGFPDGLPLSPERELAPDPEGLARRLRRARLVRVPEPMGNAELVEAMRGCSQALVIVNSRKHALDLYRQAEAEGLEGLVHLTTRQYAAHRRHILDDVRTRLNGKRPCRVVATSLVEAGVDVDFPKVWRAEAGLEQIIQAAGRCNREGLRPLEESVVTVFSCPDYPPPREIAGLIGDTGRIVAKHPDLMSLGAIEDYFGEVYWRAGPKLDRDGILAEFTVTREGTDFAFRTVAERFRLIESGLEPVIVARDAAAVQAVKNLGVEPISSGRLARELQPYVVQVPPEARQLLLANGHVAFERPDLRGDQFAVLKTPGLYKGETGLWWEDAEYLGSEGFLF